MVLNIPLPNNWRLRSDSNNILLVRVAGKKEIVEGYFSSVEGAVEDYVERRIRGFNSTSLVGLRNSITHYMLTELYGLEVYVCICEEHFKKMWEAIYGKQTAIIS